MGKGGNKYEKRNRKGGKCQRNWKKEKLKNRNLKFKIYPKKGRGE
jgi:hypothetical protein